MTCNAQAVRDAFPDLAHLSDTEIAELIAFKVAVVKETLRELGRRGEAILAAKQQPNLLDRIAS